jgi:AraC-like DNA-binding protein
MLAASTLQTLDLALRGGVVIVLLLIAALLLRDRAQAGSARLGALFALGVAAYAVCSRPGFLADPRWWQAPLLALSAGNAVVFWLFARALFDDGFGLRWWHGAIWAALAGAGLVDCFVLRPVHSPAVAVIDAACTLATLALTLLVIRQTLSTWRVDLVEGRRRLRFFIIGSTAVYSVLTIAGRGVLQGASPSLLANAVNALGLAVMATVIAWALMRVGGGDLFAAATVPILDSAEPRLDADRIDGGARDGANRELLRQVERLIEQERIYRREGLTIGVLARELSLPEYRLRRLINQGLGYRNFNAFLNHFRIAEAKAALADPTQLEVPVLTIALDAGFQSLGPFNRTFKAETGLTPSEFRRRNLAGAAA